MNKRKLVLAMEEVFEPSSAELVELDGEEIDEASENVGDLVAAMEAVMDDMDTLDNLRDIMEDTLESGKGLSPAAAELTQVTLEGIYNRLGLTNRTLIPATEAFSNKFSRVSATRISVEGIGDTLKALGKWLMEQFSKLWNFLKGLFGKIFGSTEETETETEVLLAANDIKVDKVKIQEAVDNLAKQKTGNVQEGDKPDVFDVADAMIAEAKAKTKVEGKGAEKAELALSVEFRRQIKQTVADKLGLKAEKPKIFSTNVKRTLTPIGSKVPAGYKNIIDILSSQTAYTSAMAKDLPHPLMKLVLDLQLAMHAIQNNQDEVKGKPIHGYVQDTCYEFMKSLPKNNFISHSDMGEMYKVSNRIRINASEIAFSAVKWEASETESKQAIVFKVSKRTDPPRIDFDKTEAEVLDSAKRAGVLESCQDLMKVTDEFMKTSEKHLKDIQNRLQQFLKILIDIKDADSKTMQNVGPVKIAILGIIDVMHTAGTTATIDNVRAVKAAQAYVRSSVANQAANDLKNLIPELDF